MHPFVNAVYGKDQKGVDELPVHNTPDGMTVAAFKLTEDELKEIAETGIVFLSIRTNGHALQPIYSTTQNPFENPMNECTKCGALELAEHLTINEDDDGEKLCRDCVEKLTKGKDTLEIVN